MRFLDRPRSAQIYVASICALALAATALAASHAYDEASAAPTPLLALLVVAATLAHTFPVSTPDKQPYRVALPFFSAAAILLSPLQFIGLIAIVHLVEGLRVRRSISVQVFNGAALALTGLAAQGAYHALWSTPGNAPPDLSQPASLVAGLVAAVTFALVSRALVSAARWLGNRLPPLQQQFFDLEALLTDTVLLLMGVPLAHLLWIAPWAGMLAAAPLWLIHRVMDLPSLRAQSRQDGLTELFTAPYLTEACTRELNRGRRFNRPVALLLLDVDALGELNAAHGQQTGDMVLRTTARTISDALREYDLPARLAGGLFAVLLPETDLAQAQVVAERIRRDTAELRHEVPGSVEQVRVTLSIGAAMVNGQSATAAEMFDAARAALARAKRDGGNEIAFERVHAEPPAVATLVAPNADKPRAALFIRLPDARGGSPARQWLRAHAHTVAVCSLASLGIGVCLIGAVAQLDLPLFGVMLSLAALAGFAFSFRSLPLALALAAELNRAPGRLVVVRYWRMWPRYLALGAGGLVTLYAYAQFGLTGALGFAGFALLMRHLAGRYVDRTLEGVRKLRNTNESLEHQAFHDPLTNLPNRALFAERLEHAMVRAGDGSVAVLFLDLDNFKTVNDTLGHAAGDTLLIAASERLARCVRREDTIARLGGDEFTVLLEDLHDPSDAARMAERIRDALGEPFTLEGQQTTISSSIGIALDADRTHAPDDLLREADLAMYRAKSAGKARYEIFDTYMAERAMERLGLETELRQAVARGDMEAAYRAVTSVATEEVVGLQVEARWRHPRLGFLEATEFQRIAEDTGIAAELGRWLVEQACRDARQWQLEHAGLPVHVRLSARQLEHPGLLDTVRAALEASGLRPALLHLEVADTDLTGGVLRGLRALGVEVWLGGVGLERLPIAAISTLPLDGLSLDPAAVGAPNVVRATTAVAEALGLKVTVAEREALPVSELAALERMQPIRRAA